MNALDVLLLLVTAAYGISGYWQGFVTGAAATVGLLAGGTIAVLLAPVLLDGFEPSISLSVGVLVGVLLAASLGQAVGSFAGARARERITWRPARSLDAAGGAALSMVAVLAVAWVVGYAVSGTRLPAVSDQVRDSAVLSRIDSVMPGYADQVFGAFNQVVDTNLYPRYLEPFTAESIIEVEEPTQRVLRRAAVVQAGASVAKVLGNAECGRRIEGSGFVYARDRVMTNAHVVAGVDAPTIEIGEDTYDAEVVLFDPQLDVAVLAVDGLDAPSLDFDTLAEPGDAGAVLGFPENGPYDAQAARIRAEQTLRGADIYSEGTVSRDVFSVRSLVRSGNSGGPLVSPRGSVVGVVFAASLSDMDTGYVLTAEQVGDSATAGVASDDATSTGDCA
ncbi:MAG: MarP family serine protease [Actinomycetota bacterium]|nr:MarP family serine protease [Actinomycetota bacterium]